MGALSRYMPPFQLCERFSFFPVVFIVFVEADVETFEPIESFVLVDDCAILRNSTFDQDKAVAEKIIPKASMF
jgi:hypothetical protein